MSTMYLENGYNICLVSSETRKYNVEESKLSALLVHIFIIYKMLILHHSSTTEGSQTSHPARNPPAPLLPHKYLHV